MSGTQRERGRPLVVELVGPPGAGKSTLLPEVVDACRATGRCPATTIDAARRLARRTLPGRLVSALPAIRTRDRLLWAVFLVTSALAGLARLPPTWPLAWRVARSQLRRPPDAEAAQRRVWRWFRRLVGTHGLFLARAAPHEVLVLDEGFVHRVVQLFTSAVEVPDREAVVAYLEVVPVPDLVIAVHAPAEVCSARIRSRGVWGRFEGRDGDDLDRFVANAHRATAIAVEYARTRDWPLIEIDNATNGAGVDVAALHRDVANGLGSPAGAAP